MNTTIFSRKNLIWTVFIVALFTLIEVLMMADIIGAYYKITLMLIGINVILAVGLNIIIGITGQFSLGHAGFMSVGAYSCAITIKMFPTWWGFGLGILIGLGITFVIALLVAIPTLRLKGDYLAIATLGVGEIIRIVILNMNITNKAAGLSSIPMLNSFPLLFGFATLAVILSANFKNSAVGRACIGIKEDEIAAEAMGINTTRYKTMAFVFGALLASVAGALYASTFYVIKPESFGFAKSIDILVIVVFGGMGSLTGSVVATLALGVISLLLQPFAELRMIIYAAALIAVMVLRPQGLMGNYEFSLPKLFQRKKRKGDVA